MRRKQHGFRSRYRPGTAFLLLVSEFLIMEESGNWLALLLNETGTQYKAPQARKWSSGLQEEGKSLGRQNPEMKDNHLKA